MTARVDILTATSEDALTVPIQAVVKRTLDDEGNEVHGSKAKGIEETDVVYLVEDGKASPRPVTSGISDELYVEITEGLEEEAEVIVGPYRTLKNLKAGDAVRAKEEEEYDDAQPDADAEVEVNVD
jgi:HlyD family secretion protein